MLPFAHLGITVEVVKVFAGKKFAPFIDYRLLIFSALLPDIIDKPIAHVLFGKSLYEGRAFGHSLAFLIALALGAFVYRCWRKDAVFSTIITGVVLHDILDVMWLHPLILFWPLYGWEFAIPSQEAWQGYLIFNGIKLKTLEVLDTLGEILLLYLLLQLALRDKLIEFVKKGKIYY